MLENAHSKQHPWHSLEFAPPSGALAQSRTPPRAAICSILLTFLRNIKPLFDPRRTLRGPEKHSGRHPQVPPSVTAFSILLFTETTRPNGFFLKKMPPCQISSRQHVNRKCSDTTVADSHSGGRRGIYPPEEQQKNEAFRPGLCDRKQVQLRY